MHLLQLIYDYWQYNAYGRMPWLARQICMGEMCKANQSYGQGRLQNNKYDIESPSYNNFYKLSTWKRLLCKPKTSTSSHSGNRCSIVDKEEKNYMVTYFKFYLTSLGLSFQFIQMYWIKWNYRSLQFPFIEDCPVSTKESNKNYFSKSEQKVKQVKQKV